MLAEADAWFGLAEKPPLAAFTSRRDALLSLERDRYLNARTLLAGVSEHLGSRVDRPLLAGTQPDLYRCFMDRTWRSMSPKGVVGLIHPESHFTEGRAGGLRRETYHRLRRHWHFRNSLFLFPEVGHTTQFGVHVYGCTHEASFMNAASLYEPATVDRSLVHDGSGIEPGIKGDDDRWDTRPHAHRIVHVDEAVLSNWAALVDEPGTPSIEARMLLPITTSSQLVLNKLAGSPRFGALDFEWTRGWEEDVDRKAGYFVAASAIPSSLDDVILQGPHLSVATPFAKQPNPTMRSKGDYATWDLGPRVGNP